MKNHAFEVIKIQDGGTWEMQTNVKMGNIHFHGSKTTLTQFARKLEVSCNMSPLISA